MNYEILNNEEIKMLESIERRLLKIDKEICSMGLTPLLHDGTLCFVKEGPDKSVHPTNNDIVHSINLQTWDRIEW